MKKVINYVVENEKWKEEQDKAFNKLNKTAKIDGFRPGKAPRNVFEKKYGKQEIYLEAADNLIHAKYHEIISDGKNMPIIEPKVDIVTVDENKMEVNITIITKPEVKLGKYKELNAKKDTVKVTKKEIVHEISHLLEHYAEIVEKDGKIENGNIAIINFEGFKDGIAFDGGKGENYSLEIGSNSFIPGFEEGLLGLKKGDTKDLELTFPEDYMSEDLKGKKVVFKVTVNDVKERVIPKLDAEFFEDLAMDGVNTKEDLEDLVKGQLTSKKEIDAENKYIDMLLEEASNNMEITIDEELILNEADRMYEEFLDNIAMQGLTEEIYFKYANTSKDKMIESLKPQAEKRIKNHYLLTEIVKEEKITITDKEVDEEIEKMANNYQMSKEDILKEFGGMEELKYNLTMKKAIECMKK